MKPLLFTALFVLIGFFAFATQDKKQVLLTLIPPNGYAAQTTIYFDFGVVPAYVASQDAPEVFGTNPGEPSLYSFSSDNVMCTINGYSPLTTSATIQLGIKTDSAGTYVFRASALSNFDSSSIIQLEDRQQNIFTDLRRNSYAVLLTDTGLINGRFFLHVSSALVIGSVTAGCANNNGMLNIAEDSAVLWAAASLYDISGTLLGSFSNISGPFTFKGLAEGDYTLALYFNGYYVTTQMLHVNGNYIAAVIQPLLPTAFINQNIAFQSTTINATNCVWDFGDGSQITGIFNPTFQYYQAGVFTVLLTCSNDSGCQHSDSVTITVSGATGINSITSEPRNIWAYSKTITIDLNEEITEGAELQIFDLLGQPVYTAPINNLNTVVALNNKPNGYYIVSLVNNHIESSKRVLLIN